MDGHDAAVQHWGARLQPVGGVQEGAPGYSLD